MLTGRDRGSVLLLFPAAFLVMLVLAATTIDVGLTHVRAHELQAVAESAANDSLGALDVAALRDHGTLELDPQRVRTIVADTVAAGPVPASEIVAIDLRRDPVGRLEVAITLRLRVDLVMAPALPGGPTSTTITRTGIAVVLET